MHISLCIVYDYFPITMVELSGCNRLQDLKYLPSRWRITEKVGPSLALHMANPWSTATMINLSPLLNDSLKTFSCFLLFLNLFFSMMNFPISLHIYHITLFKNHSLGHFPLDTLHFINVSLKMWLLTWNIFYNMWFEQSKAHRQYPLCWLFCFLNTAQLY